MSTPDELMEQMKASEALAALLAEDIPPRDIPRVAGLLYEVDHLGVAGHPRANRQSPHGYPSAHRHRKR